MNTLYCILFIIAIFVGSLCGNLLAFALFDQKDGWFTKKNARLKGKKGRGVKDE